MLDVDPNFLVVMATCTDLAGRQVVFTVVSVVIYMNGRSDLLET